MYPLVSAIVTSYNHAEYLDQRMSSLLAQTYHPLEIIVVDDGSTDDSLSVLDKYRHHTNVPIHALPENVGYARACNIGVERSSGEFLMFAECDDFNENDHVARLAGILVASEDVDVAFSRSKMVDVNGVRFGDDWIYQKRIYKKKLPRDMTLRSTEARKYFLHQCIIPNMSAALMRKRCFERVGGMDTRYKICADWDFWCRVSQGSRFYYTATTLNNFRTHDATVRTTSGILESMDEILQLLYRASAAVRLSATEAFSFRVNIGLVWADYFFTSPMTWLKAYPGLCRKVGQYQPWPSFYLALGFFQKLLLSAAGRSG